MGLVMENIPELEAPTPTNFMSSQPFSMKICTFVQLLMLYLLVHSALDDVKAFGHRGQTTGDAMMAHDFCEKSGVCDERFI